jgi:hypothetical protein
MSLSILIVGVMLWYGYEFWHLAWERGWRSDTVWGVGCGSPISRCRWGSPLLLQLLADLVPR